MISPALHLREGEDPAPLWQRVRRAPHRLLGLDYDGTLAEFHPDPAQAVPLAGIPELLVRLSRSGHTTVAILSGRPVSEIVALLGGPEGIWLSGSHGYEILPPTGPLKIMHPTPRQDAGLIRAEDLAGEGGFSERCEIKVASIALHTRGLPQEKARAWEQAATVAWGGLAADYRLECLEFNGGVELRAVGRTKGDVLGELLRGLPEGTLPVYIGDDTTDEDAFRAIRQSGIGIRVGRPQRMSAARAYVEDCPAVRDFLERWLIELAGAREGV